jgi:hypothetical protein
MKNLYILFGSITLICRDADCHGVAIISGSSWLVVRGRRGVVRGRHIRVVVREVHAFLVLIPLVAREAGVIAVGSRRIGGMGSLESGSHKDSGQGGTSNELKKSLHTEERSK